MSEQIIPNVVKDVPPAEGTPDPKKPKIAPEDMTSKDYYFDSYAHFGIHEVQTIPVSHWFKSYFNQEISYSFKSNYSET